MSPADLQKWREEQLRYRVLQCVYERGGANCEIAVTGPEIGVSLGLSFEDLFRVTLFLEGQGYLTYIGAGPRVCITAKGIRYMEELAGRRRSIRD